jgi:hypothetical protein
MPQWAERKEAIMRRKRFLAAGFLLSAIFLVNLVPAGPAPAEEKPAKSLCQRLGGVYNIAPVVDEFLDVL